MIKGRIFYCSCERTARGIQKRPEQRRKSADRPWPGPSLGSREKRGRSEKRTARELGLRLLLLVLKKAGRRGESWDSLGGVWEVRRARGQHGL